jgi:hypothetical protein
MHHALHRLVSSLMATTSERMSRLTSPPQQIDVIRCMVSDQSDDRRLRIRLTPFPGRACVESTVSRVRCVM